ncbi:MAG TPA: MaoC family dehydratase [Acidimicrobiia bacterium]|nr:MaoC family dehydratase [Acidimicrobiia bacterium]
MSAIDVAGLTARVGEEIGVSDWFQITQDRVDAFANATLDHQWIHQAGPRADAGPFGGPIAHGYLTLSLLPHLMGSLPALVEDRRLAVNYGLDRARFITPVRVGSRVRARAVLAAVEPIEGGVQVKIAVTVELEGSPRPAAAVETLTRLYG